MQKKALKSSQKLTNEFEDLNPRWATFVKEYIVNGNAYQSALIAGFSDEYAKVIKSRYPEKVKNSLKLALENKGITAEKIADKVHELLEAGKTDATGNFQPDYTAMDKGIAHAVKIRGDYTEPSEPTKSGNTYNFFFDEATKKDIKNIEAKIKERLTLKPNAQPVQEA